jgi:hypothetical protein
MARRAVQRIIVRMGFLILLMQQPLPSVQLKRSSNVDTLTEETGYIERRYLHSYNWFRIRSLLCNRQD